jgi:Tol biopolymer transport system component
MIGTKLAHYEITSHLGTGGMGEVYQATDSKLGRSVAIKLLPEAFTHDADRAARFEREARALASLNHPSIAAIYGVEESGDRKFLVMELADGETLAERIKRGPIPLDESLGIAKQICEALEAAHEKGIIHRDLKPANIKVTTEGKVKVLDFGLAKAFEAETANTQLSNSPTLSLAATHAGVILGTAAYMSPEQAKGRAVDKRTDIFALGCVLYEMLTGRAVFEGDDVQDILGAVLKSEPDWTRLPAAVPPRIRELLRLCLAKNAKNRRSDATDVRLDIEQASIEPLPLGEVAAPPARRVRVEWFAAILILAALLSVPAVRYLREPSPPPPPVPLRLSAELGADVSLAANLQGASTLAISPDGAVLAFAGAKNGASQIYVRRLGQLQASPLAGTNGAQSPFFSPDGQWLAFFADGKLKKISVTGGAAVTLSDAPGGRGGAWGDDGNMAFTPNVTVGTILQQISSAGGKAEPLTKLGQGEAVHRWPQVLPGAKAVLFTAHSSQAGFDAANIVVQPLPAGIPKVVVRGGYHAQYVASGHIVYIHDGTLFAVPFDVNRLDVTGQAVPAIEGVNAQTVSGAAQFAVSNTGTLAYLAGVGSASDAPVEWMTHDGKTMPLRAMPSDWSNPHFSPDGRRLAQDILNGSNIDVWIYEWARDTLTRLTFDAADDRKPVWTPDGKRIVFRSDRDKGANLYWQNADGTGEVQRLTESPNVQSPSSFHPNGKVLAFFETNPKTGDDLMFLPIEGDESSGWKPGKPSVFLNTPAGEQEPMFSPDGRWIAYISNESGRPEVFVRPFPGPGGKWQISTGGGVESAWSRTRHEILYRTAVNNRIMAASYTVEGDSFKADKPRLWSEQTILPRSRQRYFDLHPDGDRLAVAVAAGGQPEEKLDKVTFVFNFFDELRRIAPPSRK